MCWSYYDFVYVLLVGVWLYGKVICKVGWFVVCLVGGEEGFGWVVVGVFIFLSGGFLEGGLFYGVREARCRFFLLVLVGFFVYLVYVC